jgi:beta-glucosidase
MRAIVLFSAIFFMAGGIFAAPLNLTGTVKALSESGAPVENAVVLLKVNDGLIAYARTLSSSNGNFVLLPGKDAPTPITRPAALLPVRYTSYQALDLKGRTHSTNSLPQGIYVLLGKTENGKSVNLGTIYHKGGALKTGEITQKEQKARTLARLQTAAGEIQLIVRKTGYLPTEVSINSFDENVGTVVLERDPLEARIDSVMNLMGWNDKFYQMTQPQISWQGVQNSTFGNGTYLYGSVLHGGDGYSGSVLSTMSNAINSYNPKIPVTYGKDMMHGAAAIVGATVFPHNIGMGATRDSALVREACEITAKESWAGNVDLIFGPAISVPQDERWGRVYEGYGETAELAVQMGAACVRGYQGEKYNTPWRVIATAKHYLADGSTTNGKDRGNNATITDQELREIHLPGYEAAVEQGVLSVMASFNQIRGVHQHIDKERLTGWLKTELGFDGYIISDWLGIGNSLSPGATDANNYGGGGTTDQSAIRNAINAGIDLAMEPGTESSFISGLRTLVDTISDNGSVTKARIDDAVRRILRAKFRAGRMDNPAGIGSTVISNYGNIGNADNREVARKAVRKSLVLLKNNSALPISKSAKVFVTGTHANNQGYQCGGWTAGSDGWQGGGGTVSGATSIQGGVDIVAPGARVTSAAQANVIIYATGETPYAEWHGDKSLSELNFTDSQLANLRSQNPTTKIVVVFISGRAMVVENLLSNSDAFVAAWLPGSEGAGIADVLFGDYDFTGRLPFTWPRTTSVIPINSTEQNANWFPYGYGLSY